MVTLKQALDLVQIFQKAYDKGIYNVSGHTFKREEILRTKLAHCIVSDNPPLDPSKPEDLRCVVALPHSTILSPNAEEIFVEYSTLLQKEFGIRQKPIIESQQSSSIKSFSEIRETFKVLQKKSSAGQAMSWRPAELTAFHRLCVRLGRDNNLGTDEIMSGFTSFEDLKINDASIYLAERLFEKMRS